MALKDHVFRLFDDRPWAAHLYVTEQCNLDCHYCNEYDNSLPHPDPETVKAWIGKIRDLGVARIGFQGGEPLLHPAIVDFVAHATALGLGTSLATNGFPLTRDLLSRLEAAGLGSLNLSVDRMTPIRSTRKSLKSVLHKLDWFRESRVRLVVAGVLFDETIDEMAEVIDTCLERGIRVHARVIHDDLVNQRALRRPESLARLRRFIEAEAELKRRGASIHTSWNILDYQLASLAGEELEWTCVAGYKYFFVSSTGRFWLCSQVRTDRHIMDMTREDLLAYRGPKDCQTGCGVYCIADTSLMVDHPFRLAAREIGRRGAAAVRNRLAGEDPTGLRITPLLADPA